MGWNIVIYATMAAQKVSSGMETSLDEMLEHTAIKLSTNMLENLGKDGCFELGEDAAWWKRKLWFRMAGFTK